MSLKWPPPCSSTASPIWSPTVCSADSEVMGSWKMIEMAPPRMVRISGPARSSLAMSIGAPPLTLGSANRIEPEGMVAVRGSRPMTAWLHTDLPEPDSPTRARVPPGGIENETLSTARKVPS